MKYDKTRTMVWIVAGLAGLGTIAATASETVSYTYDARGRLIKAEYSGGTNNGVVSNYTIDKADNRTKKQTTGAP